MTTMIAVLGAGAWGTALAAHLARATAFGSRSGRVTTSRRAMAADRVDARYLPEVRCLRR
jgi:glycerol-3-phosphate dehydrogenase